MLLVPLLLIPPPLPALLPMQHRPQLPLRQLRSRNSLRQLISHARADGQWFVLSGCVFLRL
jgi:hypothetical protein